MYYVAFVVCNADSRKLDDVGVCENGVLNDNDICECFSGYVSFLTHNSLGLLENFAITYVLVQI